VDSTGDVGLDTSTALDSNNHPHISYFDLDNGDLKYAKSISTPDTTPPVITSGPIVSSKTDTTAVMEWTTDEVSDSVIEYGLTTSYSSSQSDPTDVTYHSIALTGLSPLTTYHYRVSSTDPSNNGPTYSSDNMFTTNPSGTTNQPPTCTISSPSDSSTVYGNITISGTASDTDGTVIQVQIKIDNGNWIIASGTTSWSYSWDTTTVSNGQHTIYVHTIYVRAFDGTDFSNTESRTVTVSNASDSEKSLFQQSWFWGLIIVIIVIVIIAAILVKKGRGEQYTPPPPEH
jgi:hypothetical protein